RPPGIGGADLPARYRPVVLGERDVAVGAVARVEPAGEPAGKAVAAVVQRLARSRRRGPPLEPRRRRPATAAARPAPPQAHAPRGGGRGVGPIVHRRRRRFDAGGTGRGGAARDLRRQGPLGRAAYPRAGRVVTAPKRYRIG